MESANVREGRAWKIINPGSFDSLHLKKIQLDKLADNAVRVHSKAIGLNFADIFCTLGLYTAAPKTEYTPGLECSGEVIAVGKNISRFKVGDKVMGVTRFGAYAEYVDISEENCEPLPEGWSFAEGSAYIVQALTSWYALKSLGDLRKGQTVLIQSAAGGVGLNAMYFAQRMGARAIGSVSSQEKKKFLNDMGYNEVIVRSDDFESDLKKHFGEQRINLVLDAVGGEVLKASYKYLAQAGRLIVFGAADFAPKGKRMNLIKASIQYLRRPRFDPLDMINHNKSVMGFNLIYLSKERELLDRLMREMREMGAHKPYVGKEFPFANAVDAITYLNSGKNIGKVVLTI